MQVQRIVSEEVKPVVTLIVAGCRFRGAAGGADAFLTNYNFIGKTANGVGDYTLHLAAAPGADILVATYVKGTNVVDVDLSGGADIRVKTFDSETQAAVDTDFGLTILATPTAGH